MRFIYTGECEVEQHAIESFLIVGKDLKVEGFTSESELNKDSTLPNMNNAGINEKQIRVKTEEKKCL